MLSTLLTVVLSLASLSSASTLPNYRRESGLLRLHVDTLNVNRSQQVSKRQDVLTTVNTQTGTLYVVNFSIGTPPQPVSVAIDTGSSDTWVDPTCSTASISIDVNLCKSEPVYTPGSSSTSVDTSIPMSLSYGIGTVDGVYWTDNFIVGGATVRAQRFGVASSTEEFTFGLMGVGPGIQLTGYPTIIDQLALQGVTNSRAFSLDLRGVESPDGAIIFGGIDTMKYTGPLEKRPIIPAAQAPDLFDRYWIYMTSVGITKPGAAPKLYPPSSSNPSGQAVFLDSGGTLSGLPTALFNAIAADFPSATFQASSGLYIVNCAVANQPGTIDFGFGNTVIHVPYREFIWFEPGGTNVCALGMIANDKAPVLGDSFLRAAYVVYDQDNQNLLLANAANCGTNLVAIGKGPNAVPSITGACGATSTSSSTSSSTTSSSSTSTTSSSSTSTTSSSSSTSTTSSSSSTTTTSSSSSTTTTSSTSSTTTSSSSSISATSSSASSTSTLSSSSSSALSNSTSSKVGSSSATSSSSSASSSAPYSNVTTSSYSSSITSVTGSFPSTPTTSFTLSTVYTTTTYTVTSCPPTVTNCPVGHLTTETLSLYTTYCPIAALTSAAIPTVSSTPSLPSTTGTVYATVTYTISSCAPTVTNCPYGSPTTSTYALYTTVGPLPTLVVAPASSSAPAVQELAVSSVSSGQTPPPKGTQAVGNSTAATNPTTKTSGSGVSPAQFTGGAVALAANFVAVVMAAIVAAATL